MITNVEEIQPVYLSRKELSERWNVSLSMINKLAVTSPEKLPDSLKVGNNTYRYALSDVILFETKHKTIN